MADSGMDGYMYFVGDGKYGPEKKSIGPIKGETIDFRFEMKGAFKIASFSWRSAQEGSSGLDDDDDDDEEISDEERKMRERMKKKKRSAPPNRLDGRVSRGVFEVSKDVDVATPTIFKAHATCSVFEGCHIYFRKTGGGKLFTFFHATFSEVIIEGWEISLDDSTKERLMVNFNWCQINYCPQTIGGTSKKGASNIKQFCTSDPDSQDVPKILRAASVPDVIITGKD